MMIEITLLFLGAVIGAGFATGAEIITFFGKFNLPIWITASIAGFMMFVVITLEIYLFYSKQSEQLSKPPKKHKLLDVVFVMIYLILFTTMTAGIRQITNTEICIISLICTECIVLFGFKNLSKLNSLIIAIIIVLITTTALPHILNTKPLLYKTNYFNISHLSIQALLYAGLNCFMFPELIKASIPRHQRKTLFYAGALTSILIAFLIGLVLLTIQQTHTESAPIPLLASSPNTITIIIILLAILSSQYTALFAIKQRLKTLFPSIKQKTIITSLTCLCAFIASFYGFNRIIQDIYPIIGAFTCVYLLFSCLRKYFSHRHQH